MSRLECLGSSSAVSKIQAPEPGTPQAEGHKYDNTMEKKTAAVKHRSLPTQPPSGQVSCQETQKPEEDLEMLNSEECASKEHIITTTRADQVTQATAGPKEELKMKESQPQVPTATAELHHTHKENVEEEESQEDDLEDGEIQAPLDLMIEFLEALIKEDFRAARVLCQIILFYEPNHPEASEFLPLIHKKLEEQEAEGDNEEDDEDSDEDKEEGDGDSNEDDEESSQSSSFSFSSTSDEENEEEKEEKTLTSCPPAFIST